MELENHPLTCDDVDICAQLLLQVLLIGISNGAVIALFGLALVIMMLVRPEGIFPSVVKSRAIVRADPDAIVEISTTSAGKMQ